MVTTRAQKAKALGNKGLAPMSRRGKKSYAKGNVLKEINIGKTPWVGKRFNMPYRKYQEHKSNTGEFAYGPKDNVRRRATQTRLVSRRCQSKKECRAWAGEWDKKRHYKKYSRSKFYPKDAALARRKNYNKSINKGGLGFIISYRAALYRRKAQTRLQAAARNAAAVAKRRRTGINQTAIISGKRRRIQTQL
jgi:hypothetical protein